MLNLMFMTAITFTTIVSHTVSIHHILDTFLHTCANFLFPADPIPKLLSNKLGMTTDGMCLYMW